MCIEMEGVIEYSRCINYSLNPYHIAGSGPLLHSVMQRSLPIPRVNWLCSSHKSHRVSSCVNSAYLCFLWSRVFLGYLYRLLNTELLLNIYAKPCLYESMTGLSESLFMHAERVISHVLNLRNILLFVPPRRSVLCFFLKHLIQGRKEESYCWFLISSSCKSETSSRFLCCNLN